MSASTWLLCYVLVVGNTFGDSDQTMTDASLVKLLKTAMILGVTLLICGHIVLAITFANDDIGHQGFIAGAAMSAVGIILSLPTKIYLTILLMEHTEKTDKRFTRSADGQARSETTEFKE
ncbi:hypothetical protein PSI9734_01762 [Pseudidiomarina piscicola]|uniref:Uncharacterized protein n=1 Tax=Pseudidiomarina piscicola TaxID=2614830 RepID=A0A6S6WQM9_9GAMM|nr:hypothetical protein PSI9734_01762 [Pseudidiomarina piscicola]VZT40854.1 hypothetical protein PSI9734_01762 [Pseudomonas aeruginosa]